MLSVIRSKEVVVALSVVSLRTCSATNKKLSLVILWQVLLDSASPTESNHQIRSIYIVDSLSLDLESDSSDLEEGMLKTKSERDQAHASSVRSRPVSTSSNTAGQYTSPGSSAHNSDSKWKISHCQCTAPVFTLLAEAGKV